MKLRLLTYHLTLLCTAWLLLSACHNDTAEPATPVVGPNTYVRMQVQVASGRKQRATADEEGLPRENSISQITIILFKGAEGGINATNADKVTVRAFCWDVQPLATTAGGTITTYTTGSRLLPANMEYGTYNVLVVANANYAALDGHTLAEVRTQIYNGTPWANNIYADQSTAWPERQSDFVMTSATDAQIIVGTGSNHAGTADDAFTTTSGQPIDLDRLAARIDFVPDAAYRKTAADGTIYYEYPVTDTDGSATTSKFRLKFVAPYNITQQSTLFEQSMAADATTQAPTGGVIYLGGENTENGTPCYVADPLTLHKGNPATTAEAYNAFYVALNRYNALPQNGVQLRAKYPVRQGNHANPDDAANPYYIVAYTAENTLSVALQQSNDVRTYATGLRFFGTYLPNGEESKAYDRAYDFDIRHRSSDTASKPNLALPLAYGIVRNNIYRVRITSITRTPDNFNITLQIRVVPWQRYEHGEVIM